MVMVMMLRWWWGRLLLQLILLNLNAKLRGKVLFSWLRGGDGRVDQGGSSGGGRVGGVGDIVVVSASSSLLEGIEVGHVYAAAAAWAVSTESPYSSSGSGSSKLGLL